ncbi:MAG: tRNA epoxyqueuosine(34) reductase QueG, partial [Deltaproteobacteria bacterium]|nr:tRNA epoxyqueuosine(34) reductase QueG [Deltaproteobacteria bacterium]
MKRLRGRALELGFARCGVTAATPFVRGGQALETWLERGHAGTMGYMQKTRRERLDPRALLPETQSLIVVAASYACFGPGDPEEEPPANHGRFARFARGDDYHHIVRARLEELACWITTQHAGVQTRAVVDTAPLLEREAAMAAGIGFIGKNTMLIVPGLGSYVVLGTLLTNLELPADTPEVARCGRCTRCLDACPTGAFAAPYQLDARRCISYLTIETRAPVDEALRTRCGSWVFGCDACQEVCPHNRPTRGHRALPPDKELAPEEGLTSLPLFELLTLRSGKYRRLVRRRSLSRASRWRLITNAAIAAANASGINHEIDRGLKEAISRAKSPELEVLQWALAQRAARGSR